jgi:hypothetical protein
MMIMSHLLEISAWEVDGDRMGWDGSQDLHAHTHREPGRASYTL